MHQKYHGAFRARCNGMGDFMATVTSTDDFVNLNGWQGNLLDVGGGDAVVLGTATSFRITLGAGRQLAGYVITVAGTGFSYVNGAATGGTMPGLVIADGSGHTVLTVGAYCLSAATVVMICGDDLRAQDGVLGGFALGDCEAAVAEVLGGFGGGGGVDVAKADMRDAADRPEAERLKFGPGTGADQGHGGGVGGGEEFGGQCGSGGGAQRGEDGHFGQQDRVVGGDSGQKAKGCHGLQAALQVGGVAVDVFEAVDLAVRGWHEFDDADIGMGGDAGGLVNVGSARESASIFSAISVRSFSMPT